MNMYLHELRILRRPTVIWVCAMAAVAALYLSLFPGMTKDAADFANIMKGYPPAVQAMLGVQISSITSLTGYYAMVINFVTLLGAIQAMNAGVSALSRETRERTADFLLVKPVSRAAVVNAKILAALTAFLATDAVYFAFASALAYAVRQSPFSGKVFFLINLTLLFIQLIFFALGIAVSVFFSKIRSVLPISLGVVFGLYLIGSLVATGRNDGSRYLSPFKYFDYSYIIKHAGYEVPYAVTAVCIAAAAVAVTYFVYVRKDIHAVS